MHQVDLTNCEREPIHIPGKIQSHGFLIAIDSERLISHCSSNAVNWLACSPQSLLGQHVSVLDAHFFEEGADSASLSQILKAHAQLSTERSGAAYNVTLGGARWSFTINNSGAYQILDFEPFSSDLAVDVQQLVGMSLSEILTDKELSRLLDNTARQVKELISYDRVMVYRFHEDGHGEVVAEARKEHLETWMGLHYPATDIPKQARELYKKNLVRLIADVNSSPADLLSFEHAPLDLTNSSLRAVSPVHIQYLKNMEVASSFSISILDQGELWGLIACHNYSPRFINNSQRQAATLVGQVLSSAISFRHNELIQNAGMAKKGSLNGITRHLMSDMELPDALLFNDVSVQEIIESGGIILSLDGKLYYRGVVPDAMQSARLVNWLKQQMEGGFYSTNNLSSVFAEAIEYKDIASGILVGRLSSSVKDFIIWLRAERIAVVNWAGKPDKPAAFDENGVPFISPRTSFRVWSEMVRNTSEPWTEVDILIAGQLVDEVNYAVGRKAAELKMINERLKEAYSELDTFSYTISHDLKTPLASIKSYAQLIMRGMNDDQVKSMADRIQIGALKMQHMIDEVLNYSRVGQSKVVHGEIDMKRMLTELKTDLLIGAENPALEINLEEAVNIRGDEVMIFQVFSNLLSNAIKYSSKSGQPCVSVSASLGSGHVTYQIKDNGVGVPAGDHDRIFELFSRSSNSHPYEGTGVGLAIVRKIMEKHGGKIWLESVPEGGSVFFVQFKQSDLAADNALT